MTATIITGHGFICMGRYNNGAIPAQFNQPK